MTELEDALRDANPIVRALMELNFHCERENKTGILVTPYFKFEQVQEGELAGWTLVYNKYEIIGYFNWQACGCYIETVDEEFADFMKKVTKEGYIYPCMDEVFLVKPNDDSFWATICKVLKLKASLIRIEGKTERYFDIL